MRTLALSLRLRSWSTYALALAAVALVGTLHYTYANVHNEPDIGFVWLASRMICTGADPYGVSFTTPEYSPVQLAFPYPLPIALLALPLSLLPLPWMATIWALAGLLTALAMPQLLLHNAPPWLSLLPLAYVPFLSAMEVVQVEPVLLLVALACILLHRADRPFTAGVILPLLLLKPHVGIGLFCGIAAYTLIGGAARRWWYGVAAGFALWWGGSLLFDPSWPLRWLPQLTQFSEMHHPTSVGATPWGAPLALIALGLLCLAWRRRDGEMAAGAALTLGLLMVPLCCLYSQSTLLLPLVLVAGRRRAVAAAALLLNLSAFAWSAAGLSMPATMALALYAPVLAALWVGLRAGHAAGPSRSAPMTASGSPALLGDRVQ
jgi:hypothetical protein